MMMMMSSGIRSPFTESQWQELEHQALVFKYMVSGIPIPPHLIFTIRRSLDDFNKLFHPQHSIVFQMGGFGRKIDPEPGRCRRTDGKKWRCSKEAAYPDSSKYCERHMHRGTRNRCSRNNFFLESTTSHSHFRNRYGSGMKRETGTFNDSSSWKLGSSDLNNRDDDQDYLRHKNKKVLMHHFLDEWSPAKHNDTQLSISMHDFFITPPPK